MEQERQGPLDPTPSGARCKNIAYFFRILQASSSSAGLACSLFHGPDAETSVLHSQILKNTSVGSTYPVMLQGSTDADVDGQLGEWLHPRLYVSGGTSAWISLEVFELGKPC